MFLDSLTKLQNINFTRFGLYFMYSMFLLFQAEAPPSDPYVYDLCASVVWWYHVGGALSLISSRHWNSFIMNQANPNNWTTINKNQACLLPYFNKNRTGDEISEKSALVTYFLYFNFLQQTRSYENSRLNK